METGEPVADAVALAVGERIRHWRTERGLLMRQLAETADIGQPFLSKIERGEASPSMLSLYRIATALDVTPGDLLPVVTPRPGATVVRAHEGRRIASTEESAIPVRFMAGMAHHSFELSEMEFDHTQNNDEWFDYPTPAATYLIAGRLDVDIEGDGRYRLGPRDTIFYPARARCRWEAAPGGPVRILHVTAHARHS
ncbi:helix-turn-helix domain-containing protein [Streptomyces sp. NPDC020490]|uniref:helix-turn-helix domain-containing protein n=1 Tax=Streptomyces sp. NPDC020490 TaxID=3365078 RepID=UPI0037954130